MTTYRQAAKCAGIAGLFIPAPGWLSNSAWLVRVNGKPPENIAVGVPSFVPNAPAFDLDKYLAPFIAAKRTPLVRFGEGLGSGGHDSFVACDLVAWYRCREGHVTAIQQRFEPLLEGLSVVRLAHDPAYYNASDLKGWAKGKGVAIDSGLPVGGIDANGDLVAIISPRNP